MEDSTPTAQTEERSSTGSFIGIAIIAVLIVAGGVYFLFLK